MSVQLAAFYAVAALTVATALGVVVVRNVIYSALLLVVTLSLTGLVYLFLFADFLALVQILIYGGTVSVLLLFALMLTRPDPGLSATHGGWPLAAVGGLVLFSGITWAVLSTDWSRGMRAPDRVPLDRVGDALFGQWAVPFEIASLVLLVALLGALIIARAGGQEG